MILTVFGLVLTMLFYMSLGFGICKSKVGTPAHAKTLSAILLYILGPAMIINSFMRTEFSLETLTNIGIFFVTTLATQSAFFAILYLILHKKYSDAKYRIMTIASVLGNVGYFGLPLVNSIFPNDPIVSCYSSVHVMSMNLLVFTAGTYLITNDKKYMSVKGAIFNPTTIGIVIALPIFILQLEFPGMVCDAIELLAKMVSPVCMMILGMRLSTVSLKALFSQRFVYLTCLMKLVVYPTFAFLCVHFIPFFSDTFKVSVFALAAAPSGAIIESLSELHECNQELAANVVLLTTITCILTLPLVISFFMMF